MPAQSSHLIDRDGRWNAHFRYLESVDVRAHTTRLGSKIAHDTRPKAWGRQRAGQQLLPLMRAVVLSYLLAIKSTKQAISDDAAVDGPALFGQF